MGLFGKNKASSPADLLKPFKKPNRYRSLKTIGEGGLARVASTFDSYLNRVVASKELKDESVQNASLLRLFITEAKLIGYLDHPGVIPLYDTFIGQDGGLCYTMKLVEGQSLADTLKEHDTRDPLTREMNAFVDIFIKLCETMAYVHDKGVVHLDLKPDNVMVGEYGEVMIMDWGNARLYDPRHYQEHLRRFIGDEDLGEMEGEEKGAIVGTPMYMSPEQTHNSRGTLRPLSDIFSLGIVLYEMMSGLLPFAGDTFQELSDRIRTVNPEPLHDINPNIPRRLSQICTTMLEKDPANRYGSLHDVLADLAECRNSGQAFSTRTFQPGEIIFKEGDSGEHSCAILSGKVKIFKGTGHDATVLATLGRGEIVGEVAIFSKVPRTATAQAIEPTTIRIMGQSEIDKELEKLSPWVGQMITGLCHRFIAQNERIVSLEKGE